MSLTFIDLFARRGRVQIRHGAGGSQVPRICRNRQVC